MTNSSRTKKYRYSSVHIPVRPLKLRVDTAATSQEVRIEIIPLIDVIFCILTFFILAAVTFSRQQAISLDIPKARTGTAQMREMLVISMDDFGEVYVDKKRVVTRDDLNQEIQKYLVLNPSGIIVLNASRNVTYNKVIELLDSLREVGGERVALATLPGESKKSELLNSDFGTNIPNNPLNYLPGTIPVNPQQPGSIPQLNPVNPSIPVVPAAPNNSIQPNLNPGLKTP